MTVTVGPGLLLGALVGVHWMPEPAYAEGVIACTS